MAKPRQGFEIDYDEETMTLIITYRCSGAATLFDGVPFGEYEGLMGSESKARYFAANIQGKYPATKVPDQFRHAPIPRKVLAGG